MQDLALTSAQFHNFSKHEQCHLHIKNVLGQNVISLSERQRRNYCLLNMSLLLMQAIWKYTLFDYFLKALNFIVFNQNDNIHSRVMFDKVVQNLLSLISCSSIYNNFNSVIKMYLTLITTLLRWGQKIQICYAFLEATDNRTNVSVIRRSKGYVCSGSTR